MSNAISAACDDADHEECYSGWCDCWCHETGYYDDEEV